MGHLLATMLQVTTLLCIKNNNVEQQNDDQWTNWIPHRARRGAHWRQEYLWSLPYPSVSYEMDCPYDTMTRWHMRIDGQFHNDDQIMQVNEPTGEKQLIDNNVLSHNDGTIEDSVSVIWKGESAKTLDVTHWVLFHFCHVRNDLSIKNGMTLTRLVCQCKKNGNQTTSITLVHTSFWNLKATHQATSIISS